MDSETLATIFSAGQPDEFGRIDSLVMTGVSPWGHVVTIGRNVSPDTHSVRRILERHYEYQDIMVSIESF